jgi:hypothetical protein
MSSLPRPPASCADLDLAVVKRVLTKHYGGIPVAAKELGVSGPDLKRLTWAKPKLLEEAEDRRVEVIARAWGQLITALYSDDVDRQMWASDKIMSSWLARDHPLAPARRGRSTNVGESRGVTVRWADGDPATDPLERDGKTITVPRYGGDPVRPLAAPPPAPSREPPPLPNWPGPHAPPPLVANRYQPWEPPQPKAQAPSRRELERELEPGSSPRSGLRRPSRGGYR